ncbi:hypothetical protein [Agrobacterium sp. LMR679]|uniref:hypothetical protein n=1 Tax=Agrobacterium sp. LMR679 TaxID=3014335 RepID=UPI0022AEED25|nr:hypothetical protein [Agrobacterium sp. LMR679]MCZ4073538.1 hypothetical protein [Agrobacterium sp. LMR679]MCZ4076230.1 hypothetical protein [Agrobacterium sp. LMR679]MCZ4076296.1 hypothetical protein [Agrobacterium sp. LMR679]
MKILGPRFDFSFWCEGLSYIPVESFDQDAIVGAFLDILDGLSVFSAVVAGVMMGAIRDPFQMVILLVTIALAIGRAKWWVILLPPLIASIVIATGAYGRYVQAGIDPWSTLPLSVCARFLGMSCIGLLIRLVSRSLVRVSRT